MRKEIVIGACFFLAGVLCACLFGYDYFSTYGFLNEYHVKTFAEAALDVSTLLGSIVWERGKFFIVLWLIAYTPARKLAPLILRCGLFFTGGVFAGACMINMGIYGLVVFLGSWFPHGILYLLAIVLILRRDVHLSYGGTRPVGKRVLFTVSIISLILLGCLSEATVGTWILQQLFMHTIK